MTAANGEPPMTSVQTRIAHSMPVLLVGMMIVRTLSQFERIPGWVDAVCSAVMLVVFIMMTLHFISARLCLPCLRNAPLNPEKEVRQRQWFLWFQHQPVGYLMRLWLVAVVLMIIGNWLGGWVDAVLHLPNDVLWYAYMYAFWTHHRLQPWCPYCRPWDDGGDPELVPDPDPAEGKVIK